MDVDSEYFLKQMENYKQKYFKLENSIFFNNFNLVSCQFGIQYFFSSHKNFNTFMKNVYNSLDTESYFIGTSPCRKKIKELLNKNNIYENDLVKIEDIDCNNNLYNSKCRFFIKNVTGKESFFDFNPQSYEYFVDVDELVRVAELYHT